MIHRGFRSNLLFLVLDVDPMGVHRPGELRLRRPQMTPEEKASYFMILSPDCNHTSIETPNKRSSLFFNHCCGSIALHTSPTARYEPRRRGYQRTQPWRN